MINDMTTSCATKTAPSKNDTERRSFSLGVLNNYPDSDETRLFLTPEACGMLHTMGIRIVLESGAGLDINYTDEAYAAAGVEIKTRGEALACDIVLSVRSLTCADARLMRKGATLVTLYDAGLPRDTVQTLIDMHITLLALDRMESDNEIPIFARMLDEIDGRAAILYAQEGLSFLGEGKGVLLSGMPGLQPCEVLIIGAGWRVQAAAKAALQVGARVTLMDNDISSLYEAQAECGNTLITSVVHPKVLYNDVKSADVIILDRCTRDFSFPKQLSLAMKDNVYLLDLEDTTPSIIVPRTVAMSMSNCLVNFFSETLAMGGINRQVSNLAGVQLGVVTYRGCLVDKAIATKLGMPSLDLGMLFTQSN
jgi:alanine dehydrogenase